jgi:hypothetical protein
MVCSERVLRGLKKLGQNRKEMGVSAVRQAMKENSRNNFISIRDLLFIF